MLSQKVVVLILISFAFAIHQIHGDASSMSNEIESGEHVEKHHKDFENRERLRQKLFRGYDKANYPDNINASFGVAFLHVDVDEERNTLELDVWGRMKWMDHRLEYDAEKYGVSVLRVPSDEVWKPDIVLYNSANQENLNNWFPTDCLIYPSGQVLWIPSSHWSVLCRFNIKKDPYGQHMCQMKAGSWTMDGNTMDVSIYGDKELADVSDLIDNSRWKIVGNEGARVVKYYDCCPEPYVTIAYNITVERKSYDEF